MNSKLRIESVLNATLLSNVIVTIDDFNLSVLKLKKFPEIELPNNRRLGHLVEIIVSELIKASENYTILHENLQIIQNKNTIGELDFIIKNLETQEIIHLELAYKFYLFDPTLSSNVKHCWIGPNRKDALHEKLEKLQQKQFPLLYHEITKSHLPNIHIKNITQKLCILAYLFVPYQYKVQLHNDYQEAVKGYYMDFEMFKQLDHPEKNYYIPTKKEWGINPATHTNWFDFLTTEKTILENLSAKHSLLCWQKQGSSFENFFIVWW
ncbi:DUF1853 family protein [Kordia sp.]|uniref:DUF1853 family protein n=1 Tax=Kordia sp. TaxID=1965332 RepID=UPI0025BDE50F|nr:DUF1853 family protein [Kordia sp.]MCH2193148.1 DUF1853 family protein [Kordia sp.]